ALERAYSASASVAAKRRVAAVRFAAPFGRHNVYDAHWRPALERLEALQPEPLITEYDGLRWVMGDFRNRCGDLLALNHEAGLEPVIRGLLPVGGVFVDVGAHVGHWTVRLADQASQVIAVEADPATARRLAENVGLNMRSNVTIHQFAAW